MAVRLTKLEFYDHPINCPYCRTEVVFTSMMQALIMARRTCAAFKQEMLIDDGKAVRLPVEKQAEKPSKRVR